MSPSRTCELDVVAALVTTVETGCWWSPISVTLAYRSADPYAVRISFPASPAVWLISRDTLADGIESAAGSGDYHLQTISGDDGDVTILTLGCGWTDEMSLSFATADLIAFLALTDDVVPIGQESRIVQRHLWPALDAWAAEEPGDTGACT